MRPAPFRYLRARTVGEAIDALQEGAVPLAGGQSLVPLMRLRLATPEYVVDLNGIPGLGELQVASEGGITIGAMVRHCQIENSSIIRERHPWLATAASRIADVQIRNRGTIGGSLCLADTKANLPPVLISLRAEALVQGPQGLRAVPVDEMFVRFGQNSLEPEELLVEVRIPPWPSGTRGSYQEIAVLPNGAPLINTAVTVSGNPIGQVGVGLGAFSTVPYRALSVETSLEGRPLSSQTVAHAVTQIDQSAAINDMHASREYRVAAAQALLRRALSACLAEEESDYGV